MTTTDPALAAYDRLLARYQAEPDSTDGVVAAQNIVERLIADDMFGRLAALRAELLARMADETRDRQLAVEYALDVLGALLGDCQPPTPPDQLQELHAEFAAANADRASSNDIVQMLDDWLVARGLPTVLYAEG